MRAAQLAEVIEPVSDAGDERPMLLDQRDRLRGEELVELGSICELYFIQLLDADPVFDRYRPPAASKRILPVDLSGGTTEIVFRGHAGEIDRSQPPLPVRQLVPIAATWRVRVRTRGQ